MNKEEKIAPPQFSNRRFRATVDKTPAGSIRIRFHSATERLHCERQLSALIYEIAAELERRAETKKTRWAISPYAYDAYLDVELSERDNHTAASAMVAEVIQEAGLQ